MKFIKPFLLLIAILFCTQIQAQKHSSACFTDTTNKKIVFPIVKCIPYNVVLDNCSTGNFDSVSWRINYSATFDCLNPTQSTYIGFGGSNAKSSINFPVSINGSYSVTIYLFNAAQGQGPIDSFTNCVAILSNPINTSIVSNNCLGTTYHFGQKSVTATGHYIDTLQSVDACDSIVNLDITFFQTPPMYSYSVNLCSGTPYTFNNTVLTAAGNYLDTLVSFAGCDSLVQLKLKYNGAQVSVYYTSTLCYGQYQIFYGDTIRATGTYFDTLTSSIGCDSIIALNVVVLNPIPPGFTYDTICYGNSFQFNGNLITVAGTYVDTIPAFGNSCDSIVTLYLFVRPAALFSDVYDTTCKDVPFNFAGSSFTSAGDYGFILQNQFGCDSSLMLHLSVTDLSPVIVQMHDTLFATGIGAIQWIRCDSNLQIAGANSNYFIPKVSGVYAAIFTANNCIATTDCVVDSFSVGGIANVRLGGNKIIVYPNPCSDKLLVNGYSLIGNRIEVKDILGRTCILIAHQKSEIVNIESLPSGIYILKITDANSNVMNGKFVKE
ncbi:MAG: hypothetical protein RJA07_1878 [Bacteroidota bacterium]|jgi:hypothetical protein